MEITKPVSESNWTLYWRLLGYLRPYKRAFALAVVGMVGTAATEPVFPAIMKHLLDSGFQTVDQRMIWLIPLSIVVLFIVRAFFSFSTGYLMSWVSQKILADLRHEMFDKLLKLPSQTYQDNSPAKLGSRLTFEVGNVSDAATTILVTATRESLTAVALLVYLLYLDWKLTLIVLTIGPVVSLIVRGFSRRMRAASRMSIESFRHLMHTIEETVNAQKVIKIFGGQRHQTERFHQDTERFRRSMMREAIPSSATTPITHVAASLAVAFIIFLAISKTTGSASATAGGFVSFITTMLLLISPIKQLTSLNTTLQRGLAACEGVFGLLDMQEEEDRGTLILAHARGDIEFSHVTFRYPGAERYALKDISFKANAGQTIALVGASGGGKSTVSALIPRFYAPSSGYICVDGVDINKYTLCSLRFNIALVSQDIVLFNDTVAANIAFGAKSTYSRKDVEAAARAANAWEFIQQLPQGLDTTIGEDGAKLSGGQRQRLAIARALLKNAPILILDEATSALDTDSERQVQAALAVLMQNRTTLVIAHRLSTIEHADCILVLDHGGIVESGTHSELLAKGGYYANLTRMQS